MKRISFNLLFTSVLSLAVCPSFAGPLEHYFRSYQLDHHQKSQMSMIQSPEPSTVEEGLFEQFIDHSHPLAGTFAQRYFFDESYGSSDDAPVFFYACGEGACSSHDLSGALQEYAKHFNAKLIALEHRYYGESQPKEDLSTENLQYLSTHAALKDLANFQQHIMHEKNWTGPWVVFGGSYPGSLAAFYRLGYPELVVGAIASSAPVFAKEDFFEYDRHVATVAGPECAESMRKGAEEAEAILKSGDPTQIGELKRKLLAEKVSYDPDLLELLADVGATAVQYGMHEQFCSKLKGASTPLEGYVEFSKEVFDFLEVSSAFEMSIESAMDVSIDKHSKRVGHRQWSYQCCTEYGYWQNANPDTSLSTRSSLVNMAYHRDICKRLFNIDTPPDTDLMNGMYYMSLLSPMITQIHFTNGANDPWSYLSLSPQNGNDTNTNFTYTLIENAAHCKDLHTPKPTDSESLKLARETTKQLIAEWLGKV